MQTPPSLWQAAEKEMEGYAFTANANFQPPWDVPEKVAINVAVASRSAIGTGLETPVDVEDYVAEATSVIEAGACGVHIDFTWVTDSKGRRLDKDLPPTEAYGLVLEPLIRQLDRNAAITVCNAGRAGLYITTLALMMGLNIRVGLEDSLWRHPNSNEVLKSNLELFERARIIAAELGRTPASADEYRTQIGLPKRD